MNRGNRAVFIAGLLLAVALTAQARAFDESVLESWLQKYGAAWQARDAAAAGRLFSGQATYRDSPYRPVMQGRAAIEEYWRTETADQRDVTFESSVISVSGNTGVAHWSATFKLASKDTTVTLDGVFVLEFDASGQCKSLREWWHVKPG